MKLWLKIQKSPPPITIATIIPRKYLGILLSSSATLTVCLPCPVTFLSSGISLELAIFKSCSAVGRSSLLGCIHHCIIRLSFSSWISEKSTSTSLCNNSRPVDKSSNGRFPHANSYKDIPSEKMSPFLSGRRSSFFELNFSGGA